MQRYFIELAYNGANYSGFQRQDNAVTIQSEVENAFKTYYRRDFELTGSSRTDAGVHALQNFFHVDSELVLAHKDIYHLNSILPADIVIKDIYNVRADAHARFHAVSRQYRYFIYNIKNPFLQDRAYYFPYTVDNGLLEEAAMIIKRHKDFTSFSKRNTQVKTFECNILESRWVNENNCLVYEVTANRFLRGMVRGLVATMLLLGRKKITMDEFLSVVEAKDCTHADFSTPSHGLFLVKVNYDIEMISIK